MHDGVDISAPRGTPVRAAGDGVVIFCGHMRGYGNVVIIRHDDHYATVYGHDEINYVREGERVRRDQIIGRVGRTGRTTGSNLHFEVRRDNLARNPMNYLAVPPTAAASPFAVGSAL
jgi:murein DD-endopeptidase MepM/ murein hydrolase activator NlpD